MNDNNLYNEMYNINYPRKYFIKGYDTDKNDAQYVANFKFYLTINKDSNINHNCYEDDIFSEINLIEKYDFILENKPYDYHYIDNINTIIKSYEIEKYSNSISIMYDMQFDLNNIEPYHLLLMKHQKEIKEIRRHKLKEVNFEIKILMNFFFKTQVEDTFLSRLQCFNNCTITTSLLF